MAQSQGRGKAATSCRRLPLSHNPFLDLRTVGVVYSYTVYSPNFYYIWTISSEMRVCVRCHSIGVSTADAQAVLPRVCQCAVTSVSAAPTHATPRFTDAQKGSTVWYLRRES